MIKDLLHELLRITWIITRRKMSCSIARFLCEANLVFNSWFPLWLTLCGRSTDHPIRQTYGSADQSTKKLIGSLSKS